MIFAKNIKANYCLAADLTSAEKSAMFQLMQASYDFVESESFENDLADKDYVVLLKDENKQIQGFTSFAINPKGFFHREYNIVYSGDTVISPAFWGSQELVRAYCHLCGFLLGEYSNKELYWYLLSKGHRTYMYLPLFFKNYYPRINMADPVMRRVVNECSSYLFADSWQPSLGTIVFSDKRGQLKPKIAQATFEKKNKPLVNFFLQKNPDFSQGTELACLTRISMNNIGHRIKGYFRAGYETESFQALNSL